MEWRCYIEQRVLPLSGVSVPLSDALGAVTAKPLSAKVASPAYAESMRDGYLCYRNEIDSAVQEGLPVVFEAAAGSLDVPELLPGTAHRIFTGAVVRGETAGLCVIPQEYGREEDRHFFPLKGRADVDCHSFIAGAGKFFAAGSTLLLAGEQLDGWRLAQLANAGIERVSVFPSPLVSLCCSGSELVAPTPARRLLPGEKYSVNDLIIKDGVQRYGGRMKSCQVQDCHQELVAFFDNESRCCDMIVTCGGMGEGKYDLTSSAFLAAGGEVVCDNFAMLPGKRILFGMFGSVPVLCLPGPPRAVATLLYELVVPLLRLLRGEKDVWPQEVAAELVADGPEPAASLRLKTGTLFYQQGRCLVMPVKGMAQGNCSILYPAGRRARQGELVTVHLWSA